MKRYVLRRDNVETGPYSLTEILDKGLQPLDLIWVENRSGSWQYPSQIEELKDHVYVTGSFEELYLTLFDASKKEIQALEGVQNKPAPSNIDLTDNDVQISTKKNKRLSFAGFAAVSLCFFVCAFLIKVAMDAIYDATRTAPKIVQVTSMTAEPTTNLLVQNALAVETVHAKVKEKTQFPVVMKLKDVRKLVKVRMAEANVSVAGLTSTQLYISNESPKLVDKATVQLTYEKPGGEVLKQETFPVPMLKPFHTRVIEVPVDEKDVKVKARVLNIYSVHNTPELRRV